MPVVDIADTPRLPDRPQRMEALLVDCYSREEELSAFDVYQSDALQPPFTAAWCDPDDPVHAEQVTVLGLARVDDRRGVLLRMQRAGKKERNVLAEQLWPGEPGSVNAIILDDYRDWINRGGLDFERHAAQIRPELIGPVPVYRGGSGPRSRVGAQSPSRGGALG
jgi:hypothetical protein